MEVDGAYYRGTREMVYDYNVLVSERQKKKPK